MSTWRVPFRARTAPEVALEESLHGATYETIAISRREGASDTGKREVKRLAEGGLGERRIP